jgi:hypothetical protein
LNRCRICREPAQQVVLYHAESNARPGYLAIGDTVSFDRRAIGCFLHYCATKGLHLKERRGAVALCAGCAVGARVTVN